MNSYHFKVFFINKNIKDVLFTSWTDNIQLASNIQFSSIPSLSHVWLFENPWTAVFQASLSIANIRSLLRLMSIEAVMPSNHLILCCCLILLPSVFCSIRVFPNESVLHIRWPSIGVSVSASVLPINIQDWSPLRLTGLISLQSKGSQESSPTPQFKSINSLVLNFLDSPTLTSIYDYRKKAQLWLDRPLVQSNVSAFYFYFFFPQLFLLVGG